MPDLKDYILNKRKFPKEVTIDDIENFVVAMEDLYVPEPKLPAASGRAPVISKGTMDGEKFDSKWEAIVWIYFKKIKGVPCERNKVEFVHYFDREGKKRKFYPDFIIGGRYVEVKGQYRDSDFCKMDQHPEIEFIDSTNIKEYRDEVNKHFPGWERDYIKG